MDTGETHARLLFIDFSSAFNTIQPLPLAEHLVSEFDIPKGLVVWILDFLTRRSQIWVNGEHSWELYSSVGCPQGCILSPLLFILHTNRSKSQYPGKHINKYANNTVVLSLLKHGETEHKSILNVFLDWCKSSHLQINVSKTKDMIDFYNTIDILSKVVIADKEVEKFSSYSNRWEVKLGGKCKSYCIKTKVQQRLYLLSNLQSFNVNKSTLIMFWRSFIETVLTFAMIFWFYGLNVKSSCRPLLTWGQRLQALYSWGCLLWVRKMFLGRLCLS